MTDQQLRPAVTDPPPTHTARAAGDQPARSSAGRTIAVTFGALLVASVLNADALHRAADQQPFGWRRDVALSFTRPIRAIADAVGLDAPRDALDAIAGNEPDPTAKEFGGALVLPRRTIERAPAPTTTTTVVPVTTTTLAARRVPTAPDPVRVLFAGDSLIGNVADGYARLTGSDDRIALSKDVRVATGLARPDVLDWPTHLDALLRERNPEVVYLMFGGNDDQSLRGADPPPRIFTPEWEVEYRRRVGVMMDVASRADRTVVWIGMPAVGRDRLNRARAVMNDAARAEATTRARVTFVDLDTVLAPDGGYTPRVTAPGGGTVDARARDGVHVTHSGADLIAPMLLQAIASEWHLREGGAA
jgi:hypothetical protein